MSRKPSIFLNMFQGHIYIDIARTCDVCWPVCVCLMPFSGQKNYSYVFPAIKMPM